VKRPKLSLCTIAYNEEQFVEPMLRSVEDLVNEVVVGVDSRTYDQTEVIVREHGGVTFRFDWTDDFAAARNLALDRASGDWALVLDPDERLTQDGVASIGNLLQNRTALREYDGFCFLIAHTGLDGQLLAPDSVSPSSSRLFRLDPSIRYRGLVHEEVWRDRRAPNLCMVGGVSIQHFGYAPELWVARQKHERNLRLLRKRLLHDPSDQYAQRKLREELSIDEFGMARS
jgi:glycosyltransferase involved in cell wall biosynthesis